MRYDTLRLCALPGACALLLLTLTATQAHAHGPAPSPLRVLLAQDGRPDVLLTNIGLAVRDAAGLRFSYGCPSQWGGLETPLAVAIDAQVLLVVGADGVYATTDRGCNFARQEDPLGLETARVVSLGLMGEQALGLEKRPDAARVFGWSVGAPALEEVLALERPYDSMAIGSGLLYLAGARPAPEVLLVTGLGSNAAITARPVALPELGELQRLSVRLVDPRDNDRLWMAATLAEGVAWLRSDDGGQSFKVLATAETSLHGPVSLCGGFAAVIDGALTPDLDFPPDCRLDALASNDLDCLGQTGELIWTCELRQLLALEQQGGALEANHAFGLEDIRGLNRGCPSGEEARLACEQDWLHFGGESGLVDLEDPFGEGPEPDEGDNNDAPNNDDGDPGETPPGRVDDKGGCGVLTAGGVPGAPWWPLMMMTALWWRGARRRGRAGRTQG